MCYVLLCQYLQTETAAAAAAAAINADLIPRALSMLSQFQRSINLRYKESRILAINVSIPNLMVVQHRVVSTVATPLMMICMSEDAEAQFKI